MSFIVSGYKHGNILAQTGEVKIWESSKQKLLGVVIDGDLSVMDMFPLYIKMLAADYPLYQDYRI